MGLRGWIIPCFTMSQVPDRLPARPVFDLLAEDEELLREIGELFSAFLNQKLNEANLARQ